MTRNKRRSGLVNRVLVRKPGEDAGMLTSTEPYHEPRAVRTIAAQSEMLIGTQPILIRPSAYGRSAARTQRALKRHAQKLLFSQHNVFEELHNPSISVCTGC